MPTSARLSPPTPAAIRAARVAAGHTQAQAAALVYSTANTWGQWERGERQMHPAFFALYQLRTVGGGNVSPS